MKFLKIILLIMMLPLYSFSQSIYDKYEIIDNGKNAPKYVIGINDSTKDSLGLLITIKQAQKIDYDYELLSLYKMMNNNCDSSIEYLRRTIISYEEKEKIYEEKFVFYDNMLNTRNSQIINLKQEINILDEKLSTKDSIISLKDNIIDINNKEIKKYKRQRNRLIVIGTTVVGGLIYYSIGHPGIK